MYGVYNQEVHRLLIDAARQVRGFVTYDEIKTLTKNQHLTGEAWGGALGRILYDIVEEDRVVDPARPLISAAAVGSDGTPGLGLYRLARSLGELEGTSEMDELAFWSAQVKALYAYWEDKPNPPV